MSKKSKSQLKKEKEAGKNSQFDPKIHTLSRVGYGFQMKKDYKAKPEEFSGRQIKHLLDKWSSDKK